MKLNCNIIVTQYKGNDLEMRLTQDIGIDLGTTTVLVYIKEKGIVLHEPSIVAVNKYTGDVVAVGKKAKAMLGRTPEGIIAIKPLKDGVISDYIITEKMLRYFLEKVSEKRIINPRRGTSFVPCLSFPLQCEIAFWMVFPRF